MKTLVISLLISFNAFCAPSSFTEISSLGSTIVIEMRYFTNHNFIGEVIDGYKANKCYLEMNAAIALLKVQKDLILQKKSLKLYDCYRPQKAVDHFVRWGKDLKDKRMKDEFYVREDKKNLFKHGYIADKSGHSRGSTVDLTIINLPVKSQEGLGSISNLKDCNNKHSQRFGDNSIDMGTGYDCFSRKSHTLNKGISIKAQNNRLLLKKLMNKYGFKNYSKEWWHYSYKPEKFPKTYFDFNIE